MTKNTARAGKVGLTVFLLGLILVYIYGDKTYFRYWYQDYTRPSEPYTLFIGSSTIDRMAIDQLKDCKNPIVYGFHNGTTESIQTYLLFANINQVSRVVLYIGENDIAGGEDPITTFTQITEIIDNIRRKTKGNIGLMMLKYSPARASYHENFLQINNMLTEKYENADYAELVRLDEITNSAWFASDGVHLNSRGYQQLHYKVNNFCRTLK